jgi:hypothetical protein
MKNINHNIYPKEGYRFKDSDGSNHVSADGWAGVIKRVINYRKRKGIPVGDVQAEVIAQACQRNPVLCHDEDQQRQIMLKKTSMKSKILSWLAWLRGYQDKHFVEEGLARERATICATCPNNQVFQDGCASCRATVTQLRKEILGPRRFIDGRLNACIEMGEDLPTVVHLEMIAVPRDELPAHCWRKVRPL